MPLLRRGFKTWCENAARGYRRELNLDQFGPLDPRILAAKLGIRVWTPKDVPGVSAAALKQLCKVDPDNWSAVTICVGTKRVIIVNDQHSPERQNNSIMHELSHIILKHRAAQVFVSPKGQMLLSEYDETQEEEADCLSGTLLVPREALLRLLTSGRAHTVVAAHFAVSMDVLKMRINLTGVQKQLGFRRYGGG
ncbi:ImmA/IrrE family metallo-endopeptidase [Bradyrhizobium sp. SZCCHNR3015]|uniref:ImmA/IrrE family metallo-endopeptidase n=1 Tax=Bradyrhizobium sp. SZCCHNR3015 TaxID=3057395 RepID=UPI002916B7AE|nr:ImmA/IrrE family metallo-endopeptidase [Bradyrhizobium sp. SZCCHNR3015]